MEGVFGGVGGAAEDFLVGVGGDVDAGLPGGEGEVVVEAALFEHEAEGGGAVGGDGVAVVVAVEEAGVVAGRSAERFGLLEGFGAAAGEGFVEGLGADGPAQEVAVGGVSGVDDAGVGFAAGGASEGAVAVGFSFGVLVGVEVEGIERSFSLAGRALG